MVTIPENNERQRHWEQRGICFGIRVIHALRGHGLKDNPAHPNFKSQSDQGTPHRVGIYLSFPARFFRLDVERFKKRARGGIC